MCGSKAFMVFSKYLPFHGFVANTLVSCYTNLDINFFVKGFFFLVDGEITK